MAGGLLQAAWGGLAAVGATALAGSPLLFANGLPSLSGDLVISTRFGMEEHRDELAKRQLDPSL